MGELRQNSTNRRNKSQSPPGPFHRCGTLSPSCRRWFGPGSISVCHPSGTAVPGMDSVYVCFCLQQWTIACQAPWLAPLCAKPNASIIALQGKWGLCPSTAEQATGCKGGGETGGCQLWKFSLRVRPKATVRGRKGGTIQTRKQTSITGFCFVTTLWQIWAPPFPKATSCSRLKTEGLHSDMHVHKPVEPQFSSKSISVIWHCASMKLESSQETDFNWCWQGWDVPKLSDSSLSVGATTSKNVKNFSNPSNQTSTNTSHCDWADVWQWEGRRGFNSSSSLFQYWQDNFMQLFVWTTKTEQRMSKHVHRQTKIW